MRKWLFFLPILFISCGGDDRSSYVQEVEAERVFKNISFKNPENSPLTQAQMKSFKGLSYFPVLEDWIVPATFAKATFPQIINLYSDTTYADDFKHVGSLSFKFNQETFSLLAFEATHNSNNQLFVPFKDLTSGNSTYGGGRYLDVRQKDGQWVLDFNRAYNPFCSYNPNYECAMPPLENTLNLKVLAGEKLPLIDSGLDQID